MAMPSPLPVRDGVGATRLHLPLTGEWDSIAEYVVDRFGHMDPEALRQRFDRGEMVTSDGSAVSRDAKIGSHEWIWYYREPPVEREIPFDVEIVHVDDDLVVIDKPHFLPTTPGGKFLQNSALVRMRNQLGNPDLSPIHRLDRATAGLLMFSARPQTRGAYQLLFENRIVQKTYEAVSLAHAAFDGTHLAGREFPSTSRNHHETVRAPVTVLVDSKPDANSETLIELLGVGESRGTDRGRQVIHTLLKPHTGRMHQLRVHLAGLGAGILNDGFYPVLHPEVPDDFTRPLQLLARELEFVDPLTGEARHFQSRRTLQEAPLVPEPVAR